MKTFSSLLRMPLQGLALLGIMQLLAGGLMAAQLFTLEGEALGTKDESDAGVRLSLMSWAGEEQTAAVAAAWEEYRDTMDQEAFLDTISEQDTLGYMFTNAATGYTIKYAWVDDNSERMVFLVTPALKTRNPYMWEQSNETSEPYSLLELHWAGDQATAKTSLDTGIVVSDAGKLELADFAGAQVFANLQDSTPYYLSNN